MQNLRTLAYAQINTNFALIKVLHLPQQQQQVCVRVGMHGGGGGVQVSDYTGRRVGVGGGGGGGSVMHTRARVCARRRRNLCTRVG